MTAGTRVVEPGCDGRVVARGGSRPAGRKRKRRRGVRMPIAPLTESQRELAMRHIGLVGMHLRNRVPTPRRPRRDREYDDLFQEGCVALLRAAARFNPATDGVFAAFALPRIRGAVHEALRTRFSLIDVPVKVCVEEAGGRPSPRARPVVMASLTDSIEPAAGPDGCELHESAAEDPEGTAGREGWAAGTTLRHALRDRFERAVRRALAEMATRKWRRRNPMAIVERFARERLLIDRVSARTSLRQIARDAGVSSGRAMSYERLLHAAVCMQLREDPQAALLLELAREDRRGLDGRIDGERARRLAEAEVAGYAARFRGLDEPARATALYRLVEVAGGPVEEVASNLYRLAMARDCADRVWVA